ncbi:MAG: VOC family protein [Acidobacteriia bacterium]|nr:VOC family protein [Terriglobia bacterium]
MGNPVIQFQILTRDPDQHAAFYAKVFGWKINSNNPLGYRMAETGSSRGISGGFWPAPPEASAFVQLFTEIGDMTETISKVTQNGGTVLIPPQTLPAGEQMAILRDPMGVTFGVVVPSKK